MSKKFELKGKKNATRPKTGNFKTNPSMERLKKNNPSQNRYFLNQPVHEKVKEK